MKKLLTLAIVLACALSVKAQSSFNGALGSIDTLTNADTATIDATVGGAKQTLTFQINIKKISGTVAGSITLYGSADGGLNYVTLATDTMTNTTGTKAYSYAYNYNPYHKYRVIIISSGTVSATNRVWLLYR